MKQVISYLKNIQKHSPDLIIKKIKTKYIVFFESLSSSDKVNEYILKLINKEKILGPNSKNINTDDIYMFLTNGYTLIIDKGKIRGVETKADLSRSIENPTSEPSLTGPKDSFTENYQTNLGLVRKRIKDQNLTIKNYIIGKKTSTIVSLLYIDYIIDSSILNQIDNKLTSINVDSIVDSADLALLLENRTKIAFPTILKTERPDNVSKCLLEGRIIILVDNSSKALILPTRLIDFINPITDDYSKNKNINFIKILRMISFIITIIGPAFYISLINYNQETIPTSLLINFSIQRSDVPFPAVIEALIMIILCEILRESDLRFPNSYGSAISILGALIIGEAAVSAGIVSPIMIIIIAITFITSLVFNEYELINAIRHYRFVFLLSAATLGILGVVYTSICFIAKISSIYNFSYPYISPSNRGN